MVWISTFRRQKTVDGGALYGVEKYTENDSQLNNWGEPERAPH